MHDLHVYVCTVLVFNVCSCSNLLVYMYIAIGPCKHSNTYVHALPVFLGTFVITGMKKVRLVS